MDYKEYMDELGIEFGGDKTLEDVLIEVLNLPLLERLNFNTTKILFHLFEYGAALKGIKFKQSYLEENYAPLLTKTEFQGLSVYLTTPYTLRITTMGVSLDMSMYRSKLKQSNLSTEAALKIEEKILKNYYPEHYLRTIYSGKRFSSRPLTVIFGSLHFTEFEKTTLRELMTEKIEEIISTLKLEKLTI